MQRFYRLLFEVSSYKLSDHKIQLHKEIKSPVICDKEYMLFRTTVIFHYQQQTSLHHWIFQNFTALLKMTEVVSCDTGQVQVHWQRWWILALFSLFTMEQCAIWNTFGPIAQSAEKVLRKSVTFGLEFRCLAGQTQPLPCSPCGVASTMQFGFSRLLSFSLVA